MQDTAKIAATAITVGTEKGDYAILGVRDPRWELDHDGKVYGVHAINARGELAALPLRPGFLGGGVTTNEDPAHAALRELREEGGNALAEKIRKVGLRRIYTAIPKLDGEQAETAYFYAHLTMPFAEMKQILQHPGDDNLLMMAVRTDQIVYRQGHGHVVTGGPVLHSWRPYVRIPVAPGDSETKRAIIERYNQEGSRRPLVGIDENSIRQDPLIFGAYGCSPEIRLSDDEIRAEHGRHVSNGWIFEQIVMPLLAMAKNGPSATAARNR